MKLTVLFKHLFLSLLFFSPVHVHSQQYAPSIIWQKCLGGSGDDKANAIVRTPDGGFIVAGSSKSSDGNVTGHHGSVDSTDAWVVKLSASGALQWQRSIGGSGQDEIDQMVPTSDGGYIAIGYTSSNDGDVSGNHGDWDVWVVKLDRNGNIGWQKCLGGSRRESGKSIRQTADGGYILVGNTNSDDGDVTGNPPGTFPVYAVWVVKLDGLGNLVWENTYGQASQSTGYDILPLADGTYLLGVNGSGGGFPPGSPPFQGGGNGPVAWIGKLGPTGTILETEHFGQYSGGTVGFQQINSNRYFAIQNLDYCYPMNPNNGLQISLLDTVVTQYFQTYNSDVFGVCPGTSSPQQYGYNAKGPGSMVVLSNMSGVLAGATSDTAVLNGFHIPLGNHGGVRDGLLITTAPASWGKCYGGSGDDVFQGLVSIGDTTFIAVGYTNSNDKDVSGNHGGYDFWVVKIGKANTIKGAVFMDYNANGVRDAGEPLVNDILVQSAKGSLRTASSTYNGMFFNSVDSGTYTTSAISPLTYYTVAPTSHVSVFSGFNQTDSFGFALQPIPGKRDYLVNCYGRFMPRPGFPGVYQVECENAGTDTLLNRTVQLIKDHRLTYVSTAPAATSVSGDTIRWTIARLAPRDTALLTFNFQYAAPPVLNNGDTLTSVASVDTTGDLNKANNFYTLKQVAVGSFDPNGKDEANGGVVYTNDLSQGKYLLYTIRFENTGTDTAFSVTVQDTLSAKLDATTIEMTGASRPYNLTVQNGNILSFSFPNILLPDSSTNAAGSQGWLAYRIKPVASVQAGDTIRNKASVYFDYNLPVATNTQVTLVSTLKTVLPLPGMPVIAGLDSSYCSNHGAAKIKITDWPPAADSVTVTVKLDGQPLPVASDSSFTIQPSALAAGVHGLKVVFTNSSGSDTLAVSFRVVAAVTPVVGLHASATTVTDPKATVVITASDLSGGGSMPLYTFAKDRGFSSLLQAESADSILQLAATALSPGTNLMYVRMRTSDTCYTVDSAVDSITIVYSPSSTVTPPGSPQISGLEAHYCSAMGTQVVTVTNMPGAGTTVTASLDGQPVTVSASGGISIALNHLAAGDHALSVAFANSAGTDSITAHFQEIAASTPVVALRSSVTDVHGKVSTVVLTATAVSGGGISPVYTFARDSGFSNIIQAEGPNSSVTMEASSLTVGVNEFYVRMKTSDSCYAVQYAVDSIRITRDHVGNANTLIDMDNPGVPIFVGPNPFKGNLTVTGLLTTKSYSISLMDSRGNEVMRQQVEGQQQVVLYVDMSQPGVYFLRLYDESKHRVIGFVKLVTLP